MGPASLPSDFLPFAEPHNANKFIRKSSHDQSFCGTPACASNCLQRGLTFHRHAFAEEGYGRYPLHVSIWARGSA